LLARILRLTGPEEYMDEIDQAEGTIRDKAGQAVPVHGAGDAAERLGDELKGRGERSGP
jgi:hypothetical protein